MILSLLKLPLVVLNSVRQFISQTFFVAVLFSVITWTSILLYGVFYWNYIPKSSHVFPVHLHFESTACPAGFCDFLMANVTIVRPGQDEYLARGQRYKIYLELEMPESEANQRIGMFTVGLDMISEDGEVLKSTHRSGVLRYKSMLVKLLATLTYIPMLLFGSAEEKQTVSLLLFEKYVEDYAKPATQAGLVIRNSHIEVYSATLKVYADFTGLRYILYNWPLTSAVVGISTNFFFVSLVALLSWNHLTPAKPKPHRPLAERKKQPSSEKAQLEDSEETEDDTSSDISSSQPDLVKETRDAKVRKRKELDEKTGKTLRQLFGAITCESSANLPSLGGDQEASSSTMQQTT
ncbi:lipid droplet biogenesis associated protein seipin [Dermacentor variabilis]|uniref:lipid droplet biogenesis associated protein seipin n=1 Tax=Dermacentor variabilis TaxID=34621 RepID=UPI003F5ADEDC